MLKKTITYTDYNGTTRKEDFYFNLTQAEVTELEAVSYTHLDVYKRQTLTSLTRKLLSLTMASKARSGAFAVSRIRTVA